MFDQPLRQRLSFGASDTQAGAIEAFREGERLPSTAEAIRLLIEIGLDAVSASGDRFWDKQSALPRPAPKKPKPQTGAR